MIHHHGGDRFCRNLTDTLRYANPQAIQIAEYWDWDRAFPVTRSPGGLGFDAALGDRLRDALRTMLAEVSGGAGAAVHLDRVRDAHYPPPGFPAAWTVVQVATTLLLTAPGIPMLFMGQEILEDKPWHDDIRYWSQFLVWWDGLASDGAMRDFLRFTQDLIRLRRRYLGLRGEGMSGN